MVQYLQSGLQSGLKVTPSSEVVRNFFGSLTRPALICQSKCPLSTHIGIYFESETETDACNSSSHPTTQVFVNTHYLSQRVATASLPLQ